LRNTHDLDADHHGTFAANAAFTDQGSDPATPASGTHVVYAKSGGVYVEDATGAVTGPLGTGGGGVTDLITGDSSTFGASLGSWTNTGGTMTRDTTAAYNLFTGNLKFVTTTSGDRVDLPISGTFKAGTQYDIMLAVLVEESGSTWLDYSFGLIGTDATTLSSLYLSVENPHLYAHLVLTWTPTADRTGVSVRMARSASVTGTKTLHVGWALSRAADGMSSIGLRMIESASTGQGYGLSIVSNNLYASIQAKYDKTNTGTGALQFNNGNNVFIVGYDYSATGNIPYVGVNGTGDTYIYGGGAVAASDRSGVGTNIDAGPDYIGLWIGEKDASTVQLYPDGDHDVELAEASGGTHHWKVRAQDNGIAIPALGMLPQYATAPTSPVEGQSYYDTALHKSRTWDGTTWNNWW
jgi:hypothetical protein